MNKAHRRLLENASRGEGKPLTTREKLPNVGEVGFFGAGSLITNNYCEVLVEPIFLSCSDLIVSQKKTHKT